MRQNTQTKASLPNCLLSHISSIFWAPMSDDLSEASLAPMTWSLSWAMSPLMSRMAPPKADQGPSPSGLGSVFVVVVFAAAAAACSDLSLHGAKKNILFCVTYFRHNFFICYFVYSTVSFRRWFAPCLRRWNPDNVAADAAAAPTTTTPPPESGQLLGGPRPRGAGRPERRCQKYNKLVQN